MARKIQPTAKFQFQPRGIGQYPPAWWAGARYRLWKRAASARPGGQPPSSSAMTTASAPPARPRPEPAERHHLLLTALASTERTTRWRPRGSSKARTRTAWSRSKTCKVKTLPQWLLGLGERCRSSFDRPVSAPASTRTGRTTPSLSASGRSDAFIRPAGVPDRLRWFWSMNANGPMTRSDPVATLEEAKAQFHKSWDEWKAWAKLEEVP